MRVVWLISARFEREWLWSLLGSHGIEEIEGSVADDLMHPPNTIFIINTSVEYDDYFERYEVASIPYAAIHLSDEYYNNTYRFYEHKMCRWIARNYWHPQLSARANVITFGLGWKDGFCVASETAFPAPADWKDRPFTVSFAGNIHHSFRKDFVQAFSNVEPKKLHLTYDGFNSASGLDLHAYRSLMNQSKYVLCPIGHCNIDCFRIYEALEAGAVPITLNATHMQRWLYWDTLIDAPVPWIAKLSIQECYDELQKRLSDVDNDALATAKMWSDMKLKWRTAFGKAITEMQK